eukprot:COSAG06_NODE_43187_length_374_cov_0.934545_1_plen_24_part_01
MLVALRTAFIRMLPALIMGVMAYF